MPEKEGFAPPDAPAKKEAGKAEPIIFITMTIAHDPNTGARLIQVQDLLRSAGTLKSPAKQPILAGPSLSCTFYAGPVRLDSLHLEHPLYRQLEYVNDRQQLTQKTIKADQAEFFVRFQQGKADRLTIEERLPSSIPKELITIKF